jgi:hypothetical protein
MAWIIWNGNRAVNRSYGFDWLSNDSFGLCVYPNVSMNLYGQAQYSATGYPLRTSVWMPFVISPPVSYAFDLLLLGSANGTKVTLNVLNEFNMGVQGAVVRISKFDIATGNENFVGSPVMGLGGSNNIYLELNNQHRFEIFYNGILYSNQSFVVTDTSYTFKIIISGFPSLSDYEKANRLQRILTCNNASRGISLSWNDTLNEVGDVCLDVYNTSASVWARAFYNCSSNASGLWGVSGLEGNTSWVGLNKVWVNGSVYTLDSCNLESFSQEIPFGKEGLFWAIMVLMVLMVIGVAFSPVIALIMLVPYFIFVSMAGLWGIGYTILLGVICVTILLMFALRR